jgi:peptide/nickel transport system substrate-binding protein
VGEDKKNVISRRKYLKYVGAGAVAVAAAGAGAYYYSQPQAPPQPTATETATATATATIGPAGARTPADSLIIGMTEQATLIEPTTVTWTPDYMVVGAMFQGLIDYKRDSPKVELEPRLAEGFPEVAGSPMGTEYTFKIRQDVPIYYACGNGPINANDVKFAFDRVFRRGTGCAFIFTPTLKGGKIEVLDDWTIKFTLPKPVTPQIMNSQFAAEVGYLTCPKCVEEYGDEGFNEHPCGTGPWKFDHWTKGQEIGLTRNDKYWEADGPAKLAKLTYKYFGDATTLELALKNGEVDVAGRYIPIPDRADMRQDPNFTDMMSTLPWLRYIVLNPGLAPYLQNKWNRKAIVYAVDWDEIIKVAMKGEAIRQYTMCHPVYPEYAPQAWNELGYKYDPEEAKRCLEKAGNPDGFDTQIWYTPSSGPEDELVATMMANYLNKVGIRTAISHAEKAQFLYMVRGQTYLGSTDPTQRGRCPMPLYVYGWIPDYWNIENSTSSFIYPESYLSNPTGFNTEHLEHPEAKKLIDEWMAMFDPAEFKQRAYEIQKYMLDELPEIPIFVPKDQYFGWKNIKGWFWPGVFDHIDLRKVYKE